MNCNNFNGYRNCCYSENNDSQSSSENDDCYYHRTVSRCCIPQTRSITSMISFNDTDVPVFGTLGEVGATTIIASGSSISAIPNIVITNITAATTTTPTLIDLLGAGTLIAISGTLSYFQIAYDALFMSNVSILVASGAQLTYSLYRIPALNNVGAPYTPMSAFGPILQGNLSLPTLSGTGTVNIPVSATHLISGFANVTAGDRIILVVTLTSSTMTPGTIITGDIATSIVNVKASVVFSSSSVL